MRAHGQTKLGFYPLPPVEANRLRSWLDLQEPFSTLDPCVCDGVAFVHLLRNAAARRYGIEIDAYRAEQARILEIETLQANTMDVQPDERTPRRCTYFDPLASGKTAHSAAGSKSRTRCGRAFRPGLRNPTRCRGDGGERFSDYNFMAGRHEGRTAYAIYHVVGSGRICECSNTVHSDAARPFQRDTRPLLPASFGISLLSRRSVRATSRPFLIGLELALVVQTTVHGHRDRACGSNARPSSHPEVAPVRTPWCSQAQIIPSLLPRRR
jgi:hypothetical protein